MSRRFFFNLQGTNESLNFTSNSHTIGNVYMSAGNVGIGTTAPSKALDVAGDLSATHISTGTLQAPSGITVGNINFTGSLYQNGAAYLGSQWTTTSGNVSYTSGSVVATNVEATSVSTGTLQAPDGITVGGATVTKAVNVLSTANATAVGSGGSLTVLGGAAVSSDLIVGGAVTAANLAVSGNLSVAGTLTTVNMTTTNLIDTNITAGSANITNATISSAHVTSNLIAIGNSNTLGNLFTTGGNVGIGISVPSYTLDVNGNAKINNNLMFSSASNNNLGINFPNTGYGIHWGNGFSRIYDDSQLRICTDDNMHFYTGSNTTSPGTERMIIKDNGNVGIGTSSPDATLDVNGVIKMKRITINPGDNFIYQNGTVGHYSLVWNGNDSQGSAYGEAAYLAGYGGVKFFTVGRPRMSIGPTGNVGIGTESPSYLLHVVGTANDYSIFASNRVAATEFNSYSDSRIKTNIIDIDDSAALNILRQIQPKRYNYKDVVARGTQPVWGFIAQQVASVLDYSTKIIKDFIPNIYENANVTDMNTLTLLTKTTSELAVNQRVRVITSDDKPVETKITSIVDDHTFTVEESMTGDKVFVFGVEVDDFHSLNKDAIFTVATAALQEVDRQLQAEKEKVARLEEANAAILARLAAAGL